MRRRLSAVLFGTMLVVAGGCATSAEWTTWKEHPTHFASGEHLYFSVRNVEGRQPRVRRNDIVLARDEAWWGRPITVAQEEILER
jgi:hypothetical protein